MSDVTMSTGVFTAVVSETGTEMAAKVDAKVKHQDCAAEHTRVSLSVSVSISVKS